MQQLRITTDKKYLICPDAIWDGKGSNLNQGHAVYIKNGRISQITEPADAQAIPHAEIIRLPGITLLPGLIDCHIHLAMDGLDLRQVTKEWDERPDYTEMRVRDELAAYLQCGIVAVRDGGDKNNIGLTAKKTTAAGSRPGPRVTATGQAVYRNGRYGAFLGPGISDIKETAGVVRKLAADGADQLKVVVSGLVSFKNFGIVGAPQFTVKELAWIVETSHACGLKVMAHASSRDAVEIAVSAGVDSVEHGYFLSDHSIEEMARRGTAWVPTLAPLGNLLKNNCVPYTGADLDVIKRTLEIQQRQLVKAAAAGVLLGIGTDAGANMVPHGASYFDELNFYRDAGVDQLKILQAATRDGAKITGLDHVMGTIEPGREPYLIGVKGKPLDSPAPLGDPVFICLPAV
ncbi:MAG: amidohydrolase family protein [Bacillota bacterium]